MRQTVARLAQLLVANAPRRRAYVHRQLGHASIKLTVDTYGRWLPMGNTAAVDRLDDAVGKVAGQVANAQLRVWHFADPHTSGASVTIEDECLH